MNEFQKIDAIRKWISKPRGKSATGSDTRFIVDIGDDAAVLDWKFGNLVVTTDSQVEDVHFRMENSRPEELGHRLIAVNLSDLAAMGAIPRAVVVSLCLPSSVGESFLKPFYGGMKKLAARHGVVIAGGNISGSRAKCVFDLTAFGNVEGPPLTRSGAEVGDLVAVSGSLGDSAAGFFALDKIGRAAERRWAATIRRHLLPLPKVKLGQAIKGLATSCMDISDGLSSELHHLAAASGLGFWVSEESLPISAEVWKVATHFKRNPVEWALHGGEDYQLLFTFAARDLKRVQTAVRKAGEKLTVIGFTVAKKRGRPPVMIQWQGVLENEALPAMGWMHR